jgi:hypothetical protein
MVAAYPSLLTHRPQLSAHLSQQGLSVEDEERGLEQAAMELDTSLLLQATPEHEVLIAADDSQAEKERPPLSWLEHAVAAVPLQDTSREAMAADLATTEDALKVRP